MKSGGGVVSVLASLRLALIVLALLAVIAGLGTLRPPEQMAGWIQGRFGEGTLGVARVLGLTDIYRSPIFASLLTLLAVNVTLCCWSRRRGLRAGQVGARRRRRLDLLLHASLVVILAGGMVRAIFGDLGTQYLFLGQPAYGMRRWPTGEDVAFGFSVELLERRKVYEPLRVRMRIAPAGDPENAEIVEIREGRTARSRNGDLVLRLTGVDWDRRSFDLRTVGGDPRGYSFDLAGGGRSRATIGPYEVRALEYHEAVADVNSRIVVREGGKAVAQGWLTPRSQVSHRGLSFHQIAWGENETGSAYSGVQISRDPGAPIFWCGAILLCVTLPLFLVVRHARSGAAA